MFLLAHSNSHFSLYPIRPAKFPIDTQYSNAFGATRCTYKYVTLNNANIQIYAYLIQIDVPPIPPRKF